MESPPPSMVRIDLAERSYDVRIGAGLIARLGDLTRSSLQRPASRAFLVYDQGVPMTLVESARSSLASAGFDVSTAAIQAAETAKTIATVERLLIELMRTRHERTDPVVALGGGIIGDTAGFAAASYRRGVPFIQCPTTLLAMVDASVGGKTGVNLSLGAGDLKKNMVGSFHQPRAVVIDTDAIPSLEDRVFRAGLAECVKHAAIAGELDATLMDWMIANAAAILGRDPATLAELIRRNVAIKAAIVAGDEREESDAATNRALLNLGHTFGHAIETVPGARPVTGGAAAPAPLHHGEAVAIGLHAAAALSVAMGRLHTAEAGQMRGVCRALQLPSAAAGLPPTAAVIDAMRDDKKVTGGRLRLVLPVSGRRAVVAADIDPAEIAAAVESIRAR